MQLLDDDEDMADLYLTRKLLQAQHLDSPLLTIYSASGATVSSAASRKLARLSSVRSHGHTSRRSSATQSTTTIYDVEELEMLLEAYFMQVDASLNKLSLVSLRTFFSEPHTLIYSAAQRNSRIPLSENVLIDDHHLLMMGSVLTTVSFTSCSTLSMLDRIMVDNKR